MKMPRTKNCYRWSLIIAATAWVCGNDGQAEQKVEPGPQTSVIEKKETGEVTSHILQGIEKDAFLKAHNAARKAVGLGPLVWSDDLAKYSLQWIQHNQRGYFDAAIAGQPLPMQHRPYEGEFKQKHGENIAWWSGPPAMDTGASKAVSLWLSEKTDFDKLNQTKPYVSGDENDHRDANGNPIMVGHYTQIVWKETKQVGAACWIFKSQDKTMVFIVANYDPPGNFIGQKPY